MRVLLMICFCALSFALPARAEEAVVINKQIAELDNPDPVQRFMNYESALGSGNMVLRSMAMPRALAHSDGRVRMLGFRTLVLQNKLLLIDVALNDALRKQVGDEAFQRLKIDQGMELNIKEYNSEENTFKGFIRKGSGGEEVNGRVSQGGVKMRTYFGGPCSMEMNSATDDKVVGMISCEKFNVMASISLQ